MPDNRYLSIGEVLGLLLEDFPDVTISKIRFLESQGLIEPERTPSGYRKFYDHDVDLLRAILHEQRENFLPLKVIRDRIESGGIQADNTGARTPPRGIRNVDAARPTEAIAASTPTATSGDDDRDSVFRRTDGGPEWADGHALIPGGANHAPNAAASAVTASVPVTPVTPAVVAPVGRPSNVAALIESPLPAVVPATQPAAEPTPIAPLPVASSPALDVTAPSSPAPVPAAAVAPEPAASAAAAPAPIASVPAAAVVQPTAAAALAPRSGAPFDREELCAAAGITLDDLDQLESFGLVTGRGTGRDTTYPADAVVVAKAAAGFLANGIEARHLRTWRQAADREVALFEQRILPLLRQRNPQARQSALTTLSQLAELGEQLRHALVDAALRHHFEGA